MKRLLMLVLAINASAVYAQTLPDVSTFSQQQIFENWVQNRCISKIADSKSLKMMQRPARPHGWKQAISLLRILKKLTR